MEAKGFPVWAGFVQDVARMCYMGNIFLFKQIIMAKLMFFLFLCGLTKSISVVAFVPSYQLRNYFQNCCKKSKQKSTVYCMKRGNGFEKISYSNESTKTMLTPRCP
jgi:hypothetical protein